jgi:hypothetical protein
LKNQAPNANVEQYTNAAGVLCPLDADDNEPFGYSERS